MTCLDHLQDHLRVKWRYPCLLECRENCRLFEGLLLDPLDDTQELDLCDVDQAVADQQVEGLGMVVLQRLEDNNIQRLKQVGKMGWKAEWDDVVLLAILDKLVGVVRAVAIEDQEAIFADRGLLRMAIKVLKPL